MTEAGLPPGTNAPQCPKALSHHQGQEHLVGERRRRRDLHRAVGGALPVDVHVLQAVVVGAAWLSVAVQPGIGGALDRAGGLAGDQVGIEADVGAVGRFGAEEVKADVVDLGGGLPLDEDGAPARAGLEGGPVPRRRGE